MIQLSSYGRGRPRSCDYAVISPHLRATIQARADRRTRDPLLDSSAAALPELAHHGPTAQLVDRHEGDAQLVTDELRRERVRNRPLDDTRRDVGIQYDQRHAALREIGLPVGFEHVLEVLELLVPLEELGDGIVLDVLHHGQSSAQCLDVIAR